MDDYKWLRLADQKAKAYQAAAHHALLRRKLRQHLETRTGLASGSAGEIGVSLARVIRRIAKYLGSDAAVNPKVRNKR